MKILRKIDHTECQYYRDISISYLALFNLLNKRSPDDLYEVLMLLQKKSIKERSNLYNETLI